MAARGASCLVWCLRPVGASGDWLLLEAGTQVTIGRGLDITYQLVSKTCPLMISRKHCVFQQNAEGQWTVKDNKSLNGVWLNKQRLDPSKAYPIAEGDRIQLGVPLENRETAEYEYEVIKEEWEKIRPFLAQRNDLWKAKSSRTKRKFSLEELETSGSEGPSNSRSKRDRVSCDKEFLRKSWGRVEEAKQLTEKMDVKLPSPGPSEEDSGPVHSGPVHSEKVSVPHKDQKGSGLAQSWTGLEMLRKTLVAIMKLKMKVQEKQTEVLNMKQKRRKCAQKEILATEQELRELQDQLCTEQEHQQQQVEELERTFFKEQQKLEGVKRQHGEENLKEQLAQVLQEHHALMEELSRIKKDFEEIIRAKNKELEETKEEKEKVRAQKEEVLNQMNDVLENELQCTICSEHFIEAVTLNCAHSFCSYCINEWTKRKVECPICRQEIKSKTRSLVLDNCIDRMVEKLDVEMKEHRLTVIRERKEIQNVLVKPATDNDSSVNSSIYSILSMSSCDSEDSEEDSYYNESYYII
ncbi:E3 ubiquitin-protein ligase RNF8 isoform X1 [Falco biarmicus]|uniref:E3 ubiquitin-protein ligase RNF8 isoform X1 n=1 Tax=Falco rusticolus TaxID=120794 RepID=UPI0018866796|nr:E3 ubiquitin-protein ligase RNF8 isoform X1 [Falco rusticolus]XP_055581649.1 E3 ubiquitin-protein ligase RNF8 isoform X1 [Falco cherrug]XP_055672180.1 E3 ubiquitin-protein ligase RNF8 isoform X1 [Falco peregrinus]XP_056213132.1 E3 ubiquitin-protein ligase RNF8 isoform X1 [Falco biarmicus]